MYIGIIGFGQRIRSILNQLLQYDLGVKLAAVTDINRETVETGLRESGLDPSKINVYADADEMLEKEKLDGVLVGTRCSLHTEMAVKVLKRNLPLFLEKPVATNRDDLMRLSAAYEASGSEVVVSFPLRVTAHVQLAKELTDAGKIGTIEHVQAINNVPYGGVYYHNWYRDENETGGLFLQKATHDFDYINYLLGLEPVSICAMKSKRIFMGNKPNGLYCKDCNEYETCPESPFIFKHTRFDSANGDMCCFAEDTGNEDSGSALIRYESGLHVSYSQNFFARNSAGARGARLFGYKGTLEFDWYTDELKVHMHLSPRIETYKFDTSRMNHAGGDKVLALNFIRVMQGREKSVSPLEAGLLSVKMCLAAKESAESEIFIKI